MPVLMWVAVLVGFWCVASVVAALALGALLRRRDLAEAGRHDPRRRVDAGPLRMWLAEIPEIPEMPRPRASFDDAAPVVVPDTPEGLEDPLPRPRAAADGLPSQERTGR